MKSNEETSSACGAPCPAPMCSPLLGNTPTSGGEAVSSPTPTRPGPVATTFALIVASEPPTSAVSPKGEPDLQATGLALDLGGPDESLVLGPGEQHIEVIP